MNLLRYNFKIRDKLIILFICLIVMPIIFIFLVTYTKLSDIVQDKITGYSSIIIHEICNNIDETLVNLTESKYFVISNDGMEKILEKDTYSDIEFQEATRIVHNYLLAILNAKENIQSVTIYNNKGQSFFYSNLSADNPYDYIDIKSDSFYNEMINSNGKLVWKGYDKSRNAYTIGMQLLSRSKLKQIGIMIINLDMDMIHKAYSNSKSEKDGKFYVIDQHDMIIFHTDKEKVETIENSDFIKKLKGDKKNIFSWNIENNDVITINYPSAVTKWWYVYYIPKKDMMREINILRNFLLIVYGAGILLAVIVAVFISFDMTKPIKNLIQQMNKAETGDLSARVTVKSRDEIGELGEKFNIMIENISHLIDSVYKEEILRKTAEIEALQAQINPHFIYNTLDSINALAELERVDEISRITIAFSKLLRAAISNKEKIISLSEEVSNISNYMTIIQVRHNNKINFITELDEKTLDCEIPKLILQPLVENSVQHGFKSGESYFVRIRTYIHDSTLVIEIEDNGSGFDVKNLDDVLLKDKEFLSYKRTGIGIRNTRKRLELIYGANHDFIINSTINKGTIITLKLPATPDKKEKLYND